MSEQSTESDTNPRWCETCAVYMTRRAPVLVPAIVDLANERRTPPPSLASDYLAKVHARHLAGLSLEVDA